MKLNPADFPNVPPLILELFEQLPEVGSDFPARERVAWLNAFEACAEVIYEAGPGISFDIDEEAITDELSKAQLKRADDVE